jgi:hypothetical protein
MYEVSDMGNVRSRALAATSSFTVVEVLDGAPEGYRRLVVDVKETGTKVLKPRLSGPVGKKYLAVALTGGVQRKVHLLVLEAFIGPRPEGHQGAHENGNKLDNRLDNLRWKTPGENNRDKRRHGTDHQVVKTHCPEGHEYTPENCYDPTMQVRRCKTCARERARKQYASGYRSPGKAL